MSETQQKKKRPLGLGAAGKKQEKPKESVGEGDDKWLAGIGAQFTGSSDDEIDVRAITLNLIILDPTNPRELDIDPDEITSNIDVLKLPESAFSDEDDEWIDLYKAKVFSVFGETKKALDFLNVAIFAADLKSPTNLLNPVSVWREETSFYLFTGERRFLAHLLLGAHQIYARIWDSKPDRFELRILQWQENNLRENLSLHEKLKNMQQILDEWSLKYPDQKMTVRKFARLVSKNRSQAGCYLRVVRSEDEALQKAIQLGAVSSIDLASELAGLDQNNLALYLSKIDSGETITKEIISQEKNDPSNLSAQKKPKDNEPKTKKQFALKVNKKADQKPIAFIVNTLVEKINSESLSNIINSYDLDDPKELPKALNSVLEFIEEEGIIE
jgi:ParB-like chromosome segregation protein Spo0J